MNFVIHIVDAYKVSHTKRRKITKSQIKNLKELQKRMEKVSLFCSPINTDKL